MIPISRQEAMRRAESVWWTRRTWLFAKSAEDSRTGETIWVMPITIAVRPREDGLRLSDVSF